jgi:hypothetical protein
MGRRQQNPANKAVTYTELDACTPISLEPDAFNAVADIPYGLETGHIHQAMLEFLGFLGFVNQQLYTREVARLESMLMPANFSSIVGEFMATAIPRYSTALVKNRYHNGHPDLIPGGLYVADAAQHAEHGIEIKASRYRRGWQGHNPENTWLMVFVFDCNRPKDRTPRPFRFLQVLGARLTLEDWHFAGRPPTSRRTITASVTESGYQKMRANWIYDVSERKVI